MGLWADEQQPAPRGPVDDYYDVFSQPPGSLARPSMLSRAGIERERIFPVALLIALSCFSFLLLCYHLGLAVDAGRLGQLDPVIFVDVTIFGINSIFPIALVKIPQLSCERRSVVLMGVWPLSVMVLCPFAQYSPSLRMVHLGTASIASAMYLSNTLFRDFWLCEHLILFSKSF